MWIKPSETVPVVIGEFGPADMGGGNQMTIEEAINMMDEAEIRDIPYAAWTFHQRCPPSLLEDHNGSGCGIDMELTPTEWGSVIRNRLSQPWKSQ